MYLTKRQAECAMYLLDGFTAKEIGKFLDISFRTVETYIEQTKLKFNCASKDDLVREIGVSGLQDVFKFKKKNINGKNEKV